MRKLSQRLREHFAAVEIQSFQADYGEDEPAFVVPYDDENCGMFMSVQTWEADRRMCFCVTNGVTAPANRIAAACEFACRVSQGMPIGTFWVEPDSGAICFAITAALADLDPSPSFLNTMIANVVHTYSLYYGALCRVLYGGVDPAAALRTLEGPPPDEVDDRLAHLLADHDSSGEPISETEESE